MKFSDAWRLMLEGKSMKSLGWIYSLEEDRYGNLIGRRIFEAMIAAKRFDEAIGWSSIDFEDIENDKWEVYDSFDSRLTHDTIKKTQGDTNDTNE